MGGRLPISAFPSMFSQSLQRGAKHFHAAKSLYRVSARIPCFWIILSACKRLEMIERSTPNDSASSSYLWHGSSSSNISNCSSSIFFGQPGRSSC